MGRLLRFVALLVLVMPVVSAAQVDRIIQLPNPDSVGGRPFMQVLKERKTSRTFSGKELSSLIFSGMPLNF